jgi:hypothetical protein
MGKYYDHLFKYDCKIKKILNSKIDEWYDDEDSNIILIVDWFDLDDNIVF